MLKLTYSEKLYGGIADSHVQLFRDERAANKLIEQIDCDANTLQVSLPIGVTIGYVVLTKECYRGGQERIKVFGDMETAIAYK